MLNEVKHLINNEYFITAMIINPFLLISFSQNDYIKRLFSFKILLAYFFNTFKKQFRNFFR